MYAWMTSGTTQQKDKDIFQNTNLKILKQSLN